MKYCICGSKAIARYMMMLAATLPQVDDEPSLVRIAGYEMNDAKTSLDFETLIEEGTTRVKFEDEVITLTFERDQRLLSQGERGPGHKETLYLSSTGGKKSIESFAMKAIHFVRPPRKAKVIVRVLKNGYWQVLTRLPKRSLDTVHLPDECKTRVVEDMKMFMKSEDEYVSLGIPYKRNYLFSGPPGTGKTSFVLALASEFGKDVGFLNLGGDLDDAQLFSAVSNIPSDSIIVIEDVDVIVQQRTTTKTMITMQGLLNALDGMACPHGSMVFITTNHKDQLDPALMRPGRVDVDIKFELCKPAEKRSMVRSILGAKRLKVEGDEESKDSVHSEELVERLVKMLQRTPCTTASLQKFLFLHRKDPDILEHVGSLQEDAGMPPDTLYM